MKLLFDQNLSPRLIASLADLFPQSCHVRDAGLERADDLQVWQYALQHGFAIVTKDSDFQERSQLAASAPKIVWIRRGNCSTNEIAALLRRRGADISLLEQAASPSYLVLL